MNSGGCVTEITDGFGGAEDGPTGLETDVSAIETKPHYAPMCEKRNEERKEGRVEGKVNIQIFLACTT